MGKGGSLTLEPPAGVAMAAPKPAEPAFDPVEGGRLDIVLLVVLAAVFVNIGKPQELLGDTGDKLHLGVTLNMLAFLLTLVLGTWRGERLRATKETGWIVAFAIVGLMSIPFSVWPGGAVDSWRRVFVPDILLTLVLRSNIDTGRRLRWLIRAVLLGVGVLVAGMFLFPVDQYGRVSTGLTYDANDLGMIFVAAVPLLLSQFVGGGVFMKLATGAFGLATLVALLRTGSRGAVLGLAITALFLLVRRTPRVRVWQKVIMIGVGVLLVSYKMTTLLSSRFSELYSGQDYNLTGPGRIELWKSSISLALKFPFGVGVGQFGPAMGYVTRGSEWHTAHNSLIQVAVEMSVLGLIVYLLFLRGIWTSATRIGRKLRETDPDGQVALEVDSIKIMLFGYFVTGMFLSQAYFLLIPIMLASLGGVREQIVDVPAREAAAAAAPAPASKRAIRPPSSRVPRHETP